MPGVLTPVQALRDLRVYLERTLPRRIAARQLRPGESAVYDQVRRELARILNQVPPGLLGPEFADPEARRREINALYAASFCLLPYPTRVALVELRERLIQELRPTSGSPSGSSQDLATQGAPGAPREP